MSCYISSNENRFYAGLETSYGQTPTIGSQNRLPAVKLSIKHGVERSRSPRQNRRAKLRRIAHGSAKPNRVSVTQLSYRLDRYVTEQPGYGPLFGQQWALRLNCTPVQR